MGCRGLCATSQTHILSSRIGFNKQGPSSKGWPAARTLLQACMQSSESCCTRVLVVVSVGFWEVQPATIRGKIITKGNMLIFIHIIKLGGLLNMGK